MFAALLLGLAGAAVFFALDVRRRINRDKLIDDMDDKIDKPLLGALRDDSIRLVSCAWLLQYREDVIKQRQELPGEAFLHRDDAEQLLRQKQRKVLALSYGWQSADHPDPNGKTLKAVRSYLQRQKKKNVNVEELALFWDFASCPQKPRYGEQVELFKAALKQMGNLYASVMGTAVLILKDIPQGSKNDMAYDSRGWCNFEQGVARMAVANIAAASDPSESLRAAEKERPKLTDISDGRDEKVLVKGNPERELDQVRSKVKDENQVTFSNGKDDRDKVIGLLDDFYKLIKQLTDSQDGGADQEMNQTVSI